MTRAATVPPWRAAGAVGLGALFQLWPALLSGYPLLFSDTAAFLHQTQGPLMIWDKPWIYGPLILPLHLNLTLWPVALAQALLLSHLLWLSARTLGAASPGGHLLLTGGLAALTPLPFVASLVMPDALTPAVVLALLLLGLGWAGLTRGERGWLLAVGALGGAAHLSHLPVMAALLVPALLLGGWRGALRAGAPLLGAVVLLLVTNLAGHGRLSLSPHGSTFLLARLVATGTAARTVEAGCPARGWHLCGHLHRLPDYREGACPSGNCPRDTLASDRLLWEPDSPVNSDPDGTRRFLGGAMLSAEAREVVGETLRREPFAVLGHATRDTLRQLIADRVGDTLERRHLGEGLRGRILPFGAAEVARYDGSAQFRDRLPALVSPFLWPHAPVRTLSALALLALAWRWRGSRAVLGVAGFVAVAVLANAFSTGALSGPHDRYGARVSWLWAAGAGLVGLAWWRGALLPYHLTFRRLTPGNPAR